MTKQEARKVLSTVKFLNHKFEIVDNFDRTTLVIKVNAPDSRDRFKIVKIMHQSDFNLEMIHDAYHLTQAVFEALVQTLRHEAAELFYVNEVLPFDEHDSHEQKHAKQELVKAMFNNEQDQNSRTLRQDSTGVPRT